MDTNVVPCNRVECLHVVPLISRCSSHTLDISNRCRPDWAEDYLLLHEPHMFGPLLSLPAGLATPHVGYTVALLLYRELLVKAFKTPSILLYFSVFISVP